MTDYLEEALERTSALLEEIQRLERSRPGKVSEEQLDAPEPEDSATPVSEGARTAQKSQRLSGERTEDPGRSQPFRQEPGAAELRVRNWDGAESLARTDRPPLLAQLVRLERASAILDGPAQGRERPFVSGTEPAGRQDGWPRDLSGSGRAAFLPDMAGAGTADWTPVSGSARTSARAADEIRWAERTDRIFRRDSRRYDGGFYLY